MKTRSLFCTALLLASPAWSGEPGPVPLPAERYSAMAGQSPFALATVTAAPVAPQASFAANWYVSGIARLGESDFVTIKSRDAAMQFSLFGRELNKEHGVSVASVNWSETIGRSTVILQKGTEMAKLEFNEADLRGPTPTTTPAPTVTGAPGNLRRPTVTGASININAAPPNPLAPPPVVTPSQSVQQFPPTNSSPPEPRRRERVISVPK